MDRDKERENERQRHTDKVLWRQSRTGTACRCSSHWKKETDRVRETEKDIQTETGKESDLAAKWNRNCFSLCFTLGGGRERERETDRQTNKVTDTN